MVLLSGPAGVGKSRLAGEAMALAEAAGFATFTGHTHELVRDVAYAPFTEAFGGWLRECDEHRRDALVGDLPQLSFVIGGLGLPVPAALGDPTLERARLMDGFARMVERLAGEEPLALLIDDVHGADAATAALVPYLVATVTDLPVLLVLTARAVDGVDDGLGTLIARLNQSSWAVERRQVGALTEPDSLLLVEALLAHPFEASLAQLIVERCAGRPLFVESVTRTLVERGLIALTEGVLHLSGGDLPLPDDVRTVLRDRLTPLSGEQRALLQLIAVSGGDLDPELLSRAAQRASGPVLEDLDALYQRGLIVANRSTTGYETTHGLLRDTVLAELSPVAAARAHSRVAKILMDEHPDHPRLPEHVLAAGSLVDPERALALLRRGASHAALLGATEDVVRYLTAAADIVRDTSSIEVAGDVLADLCRAWQWLGDAERAVQVGRDAVEAYAQLGDALGVGRMERELATAAWSRGDLPQVRACLAAAHQALDGLEPSPEHAWLLHAELITAIRTRDDPGVEAAAAGLRRLTDELDAPVRAHAFLAEGARCMAGTDYIGATEFTLRALDAASSGGDEILVVRCHDQLSVAAACQLDLPALRRHSEAALAVATRLGAPLLQGWPRGRLALVDLLTGDWDAALRGCSEVLAVCERLGGRRELVGAFAGQAWVLLHRGRLPDARHYLEQAREAAHPTLEADSNVFNAVLFGEVCLALAEGAYDQAAERAAPLEQLRGGWFPALAAAAAGEARIRCGDPDGARRVGVRLTQVRSCATALPATLTAWLDGQADVACGARQQGAELLDAARSGFEQLGLPYYAARAALGAASALAATPAAAGLARGALETFDHLGAPIESQQARALLRTMGVVPSRGRKRSTVNGLLSNRELEVARLVATGRTNADIAAELFISPRTVTTHLNRIYARLGLSSRVALTRYLLDCGLLDDGR